MSLENSEGVMSTAVNERLYSLDYERENQVNNVTSQFPCPPFHCRITHLLLAECFI